MNIKTKFDVGDEIVFMHRNYPSEGVIEGIKIDVDCGDNTNPNTMKGTTGVKIIYKIRPNFEYEKEYIYAKSDLIFADYGEMKQYFFPG